ncbi:hypothetical protein MJO28_010516 [Puccinia striiformis f. sp. tritici]|uniref:Uncharacterized protein n=1 Tax=Puccinia striiformis f. sp. tritici TaxID=168172 RepID=A0ACC0E606_9BASI|nr:hypothetical protein MJO28_010516 [Puccinia striiformis f. sp. tritici]
MELTIQFRPAHLNFQPSIDVEPSYTRLDRVSADEASIACSHGRYNDPCRKEQGFPSAQLRALKQASLFNLGGHALKMILAGVDRAVESPGFTCFDSNRTPAVDQVAGSTLRISPFPVIFGYPLALKIFDVAL